MDSNTNDQDILAFNRWMCEELSKLPPASEHAPAMSSIINRSGNFLHQLNHQIRALEAKNQQLLSELGQARMHYDRLLSKHRDAARALHQESLFLENLVLLNKSVIQGVSDSLAEARAALSQ